MDLTKAKNNYATYIYHLNKAIKQSGITKIKSSIAPRYSDFLGQRGYRIEFDKNFDGEIPDNLDIKLYDTRGNETKDPLIIINYLKALTKKINEEGLTKKNGLFSEFLDKLSGGLNFIEDLARNLTKFSLNYCVVKPVVKFIDFVANNSFPTYKIHIINPMVHFANLIKHRLAIEGVDLVLLKTKLVFYLIKQGQRPN